MAERMDVEDFFAEIVPDLLKYASAFRKCGFLSSVTMKYWREQDFQNLEVEVPEGRRRRILNRDGNYKIGIPEPMSGENRSSFIYTVNRKGRWKLEKKVVSVQEEIFQWHFTKVLSRKASHASHCPPELRV